ncbi:hypothetical protein PanWU01x14_055520 [Parasponia andersonii]|uniref:Uncharacterized protein n=1 Tax=Parasponia andersonii TaxID=3476 RepID=A0A2P5DK35_PARAD|nr:hypothetical protein PanWU01x14_055520 [Parasponia andersonii]
MVTGTVPTPVPATLANRVHAKDSVHARVPVGVHYRELDMVPQSVPTRVPKSVVARFSASVPTKEMEVEPEPSTHNVDVPVIFGEYEKSLKRFISSKACSVGPFSLRFPMEESDFELAEYIFDETRNMSDVLSCYGKLELSHKTLNYIKPDHDIDKQILTPSNVLVHIRSQQLGCTCQHRFL